MEVITEMKFAIEVSNEMNIEVEEANNKKYKTKEIQYVTETSK